MNNLRLFKYIKFFFNIRFRFDFPKKNKILLFDEIHADVLKIIFKKDFNILEIRKKNIYFWIYLKQIIFFDFKFETYCINYIKFTSPNVIICFNTLRFQLYQLKNYFKDINFISISNGTYFDNKYEDRKKSWPKNLKCDYLFVNNKFHVSRYKKIIKSNYRIIGYFRNNLVKINKTKPNKQFLYLSTLYENYLGQVDYDPNNFHKKLLNYINLYLIKYNKKIHILLRSSKEYPGHAFEIDYYKKIFQLNCVFHQSNQWRKKYRKLDDFENIIFTFTAMGYEAIARKKKVAVFAPYKTKFSDYKYNVKTYFGWPGPDKKEFRFFSTKKITYNEVERVLNNVNNCSQLDWNKKYYNIIKDQSYYDSDNKEFRDFILKLAKI